MNGGLGERRSSAGSIAESFVLIDEMRFLSENERKGLEMNAFVKTKGSATSISTSELQFLITTIGERYLAFDAGSIQGVLTNEEASLFHDPIVEGRAYRIVDLSMRLNLPNERPVGSARMVLITHGSCRGCARVDMVHGTLKVQRSQVLPFPAQFRGPEQRWYLGMIPFDRSVALILNIAWILEDQVEAVISRSEQRGMEPIAAVQGAAESKNQRC